jgi:Mce-associated membrane protein
MTTGRRVSATEDPATGDEPSAAQRAALDAVRAAEEAAAQAREAQRQAEERARRLAEDYQRLVHATAVDGKTAVDGEQQAGSGAAAADSVATDSVATDAVATDAVAADAVRPDTAVGAPDAGDLHPGDPGGGRPSRLPFRCAVAALVAALMFAVVALVVHLTASSGGSAAAAARDAVLLDARQDIVVLNTLDYRSVDTGLKRWSDASTGTLHDSLAHVGAATRKHIVAARRVTTAKVLAAAVVALDTTAGSATVIAGVELHVAPANGGAATIRRERLRAEMSRVGGTWKVASLSQVGVTVG